MSFWLMVKYILTIKKTEIMARFILDVANLKPSEIKYIQEVIDRDTTLSELICTIVCIDETNEGQFYDNNGLKSNRITNKQINNFKTNYPT